MSEKEMVILKKPQIIDYGNSLPKSLQSADTFFHFVTQHKFLVEIVKKKKLFPRYCEESLEAFDIEPKRELVCSKCFCDIPLHKVNEHRKEYGDYCIGLSKDWGIRSGLQPVIYYNPESYFVKTIKAAYDKAMIIDDKSLVDIAEPLNYCLKYQKCISGYDKRINRNKFYTDEKEWRYVPEIGDDLDFGEVIIEERIIRDQKLRQEYNKKIKESQYILNFKCDDIKYIFVKSDKQRMDLIKVIQHFPENEETKNRLITKICVWNEMEGDF